MSYDCITGALYPIEISFDASQYMNTILHVT